jgi:CxxC-x17-CxxC domain-containing protein
LAVPYADKALLCRDCGSSFNFSAGEQSFFAARGFVNEPLRCLTCRNRRKDGASAETHLKYGPAASFGGRTARQMHPATCSGCGQMTEVPFVPREDRPVFCAECFTPVKRAGEPSRAGSRQRL